MLLRRWWWAPLLALVLPLLVTWPAVLVAPDHVLHSPNDPDIGAGLWWPEAFARSVVALEDPFFRKELAWPEGQDTRLLLWNFLPQILMMPLVWLGRPLGMNAASLLFTSLNGLACGWLAWTVRREPLAVAVGIVAGVSALYPFMEGASGRPEQALVAPVALYLGSWQLLNEESSRGRVLLAGLALALAGAAYWFYAYFLVLLSPLLARRPRDLVAVGAASFVFVLPFLLPVACAMAEADNAYAGMLADAGDPVERALHAAFPLEGLLGPLGPPAHDQGARFSALALPAVALALWKRQWRIAAVLALSLVMAMGYLVTVGETRYWMPMTLLRHLPGWERFWWPYRWIGVAVPSFAAACALLPRARWQAALLSAVLVAEGFVFTRALPWAPCPQPLEVQGPAVLVPLADTSNALVGLLPVGTQVDSGLAFNNGPAIRGEVWEDRRNRLPIFVAIDAVQQGRKPGDYTPEELAAGGFRSVVVQRNRVGPPVLNRLKKLLGEPVHDGELVVFVLR